MNAMILVSVVTTVTIHKDHTTVTVEMDLCYKMMEKHVKVYINNLLVNNVNNLLDINECTLPDRVCSHFCTNTNGSYYCSCRGGYTLTDNEDCLGIYCIVYYMDHMLYHY